MVDRTAEAFGMQPATSRGRNVPRRDRVEDQTEEAFATEEPKGIGYAELLLDNIIGLDNQYESTGEAFGKAFNEDELGTLKNMAVSAYEGAKEFVTSPIETTGNIVNDIRDSVYRLGSEDLDARIKRMYGIGYQDATDEQVTKAREAVIGDAVTASSLIPAAKGIKSVATVAADAMLDGYDPNTLYVFGGVKAKQADIAKATEASEMFNQRRAELEQQSAGQPRYTPPEKFDQAASYDVWQQTGWFRGRDGKMRFEINDAKSQILPQQITAFDDKKAFENALQEKQLYDAAAGIGAQAQYKGPKITTVGDVLKHDQLFANYPQIADIPIFVDNTLGKGFNKDTLGYFSTAPGKNLIAIRQDIASDPVKLRSTLLHEIQHYIQNIENFEGGANAREYTIITVYDLEKSLQSDKVKKIWDEYIQDVDVYNEQAKKIDAALEQTKQKLPVDVLSFALELAEKKYGVLETEILNYLSSVSKDKLFSGKVEDNITYNLNSDIPFTLRYAIQEAFKLAENPNTNFKPQKKSYGNIESEDSGKLVFILSDLQKLSPSDFFDYFNVTISSNMKSNDIYSQFLPPELANIQPPKKPLFIDPTSKGISIFDKYGIYRRNAGETEARLAQQRMDMPEEVTSQDYPRASEDVPAEFQWTREELANELQKGTSAFAEGGTVMPNTETQMNRLMQEGGIADDGMRRDPVSGNEIPPGSMATEVRDDIPAQLSEGEYIVPADVLRYYGVAFFEQLRAKAKRGLAEMEAGGRIGGEPVEMEDEDDLPFDISELQTSGDDTDMQMAAMGMAKGGVVKMQQGGVATDATATKTFDPTMYQTPGGTLFNASAGTQQQQKVEYRVYQNAQGQTMSILFINGVAQQPIPEGFFPQGEGPKVEEPVPTDRGDRDETPQPPQKSFNEYTVEDWISYKPDTGVGSTLGQIAGGIIGGALLGPAGAMLGAKGMQESMARNSISAYNSLNEYVGAMNKSDPNYSALADKRNKMYGDLTAAQEENPGFFSNIINSVFGKPTINPPKTGVAAAARAATTAAAPATSRDDDKAPAAATGGGAAAAPAGTTTLGGKTVSVGYGAGQVDPGLAKAAAAAEKSKATSAATAKSYKDIVDEQYGALAKGGLMMKKPQPKKATQKRKIKTTDA